MIKTIGVLHFTIPVSNTSVSKKFYEDILGFTTIQHVPQIDMVFMRCGEDFVNLTKSKTPIKPNNNDDFLIHHAFKVGVNRYDEAKQFIIDTGIRIIHEEHRYEGIFHGKQFYFHDPDRNVIEINALEKVTDGFTDDQINDNEYKVFPNLKS
tara:strand:- start:1136 stop:1591 length:456 start_codon:yes stop_codon:yes gene_type:complete